MKKLWLFLFFVTAALAGEDSPEPGNKTLSPYFWVKPSTEPGSDAPASSQADPLPLKSTQVEVNIAGVIADVTVTQVYANRGSVPLEAVYIFPGSTRAAVHGLTLTIGNRRIEAKIKKREEARRTYEAAKTAGKTASLLEQHRPNVFQMNVANVLPGDEVRVELHYTELLTPTDGVYEFVYPGVVGPRYSRTPSAGSSADDHWVANPYLPKGSADPMKFNLGVTLAAGMPLQEIACRTHETQVAYHNKNEARIALAPSETQAGNRDFILHYRLTGGAIQSGLLLAEGQEENFFLLMTQPPARVTAAQLPPRDYLFIVDVSGSMNGFPLQTAKRLVRDLLSSLRPQDTFNLLLFAGDSQVLAPNSLPATAENMKAAQRLLEEQNGGGGTELMAALQKAFALPRSENAARTIAVITDGYVDVEPEAFELARHHLGEANLFAFGIGTAVNRHLIEGLARVGQGEPFVVSDEESSASAAAKFRDYISSPVLTHVAIDFGGLDVYDVEPAAVPDVFAQRPIVVFGKWRGKPTGLITVRGLAGSAQPYESKLELSQATRVPSSDGLAHLWARARITELSDLLNLHADDERLAQVTTLGLNYHLLTKTTSFIAVDEVVRRTSPTLQTIKQPLALPQGVENTAVGQNVPTSPEPATVALLAIAGLAFALVLWRRRGRGHSAVSLGRS